MKVKTAYRPKKPEETAQAAAPVEGAPDNIPPAPELNGAPALEQESEPQLHPQPAEAAGDVLKAQIAEMERARELNRQAQIQAAMAAQPVTRAQLLEHWRHNGVSAANLEFLERNPELIDGWQLTTYAANEAARLGHKVDTDAHREATREIFHKYLHNVQQQSNVSEPEMYPPPKSITPPSRPQQPRQPRRDVSNSIVSAPVSRELPGRVEPNRVTLSPDEVEAARVSGISVQEYAKQKQRVAEARARGELQGER